MYAETCNRHEQPYHVYIEKPLYHLYQLYTTMQQPPHVAKRDVVCLFIIVNQVFKPSILAYTRNLVSAFIPSVN